MSGWQRVWWRICARFWAARYLRALRRATTVRNYTDAARMRQRSEKFFRQYKGDRA